jgi:hypothetical protein
LKPLFQSESRGVSEKRDLRRIVADRHLLITAVNATPVFGRARTAMFVFIASSSTCLRRGSTACFARSLARAQ